MPRQESLVTNEEIAEAVRKGYSGTHHITKIALDHASPSATLYYPKTTFPPTLLLIQSGCWSRSLTALAQRSVISVVLLVDWMHFLLSACIIISPSHVIAPSFVTDSFILLSTSPSMWLCLLDKLLSMLPPKRSRWFRSSSSSCW